MIRGANHVRLTSGCAYAEDGVEEGTSRAGGLLVLQPCRARPVQEVLGMASQFVISSSLLLLVDTLRPSRDDGQVVGT